jgi:hypothetical protein
MVLLYACLFSFLQCGTLSACCNCSPCLVTVHVGNVPQLCGGVCLISVSVASLPLSKHTGNSYATPAFSCRLIYLQFVWGSAPPPLSGALGTLPSLLCVHFFYCLFIIQFFCFLLSVCLGDYDDFPQVWL